VVWRRGRLGTVCARVAWLALPRGPSTSPLDGHERRRRLRCIPYLGCIPWHFAGDARMKKHWRWLLTSAWIGSIWSSSCASFDDVPSPFRRDVQCMVNVLRKTPRVDQVSWGAFYNGGWTRPFVQYRYDGGGTVRFTADKTNPESDSIQYVAYLNGVFTHGGPSPPTLGTGEIAGQWTRECHVSAFGVFP